MNITRKGFFASLSALFGFGVAAEAPEPVPFMFGESELGMTARKWKVAMCKQSPIYAMYDDVAVYFPGTGTVTAEELQGSVEQELRLAWEEIHGSTHSPK